MFLWGLCRMKNMLEYFLSVTRLKLWRGNLSSLANHAAASSCVENRALYKPALFICATHPQDFPLSIGRDTPTYLEHTAMESEAQTTRPSDGSNRKLPDNLTSQMAA